ncbi:MAG: sigma-E factor negative regulatory protein [Arenicellales bacterium]
MREKLSAFLDGELGHAESLKLIRQLDVDMELRGQWQRYHTYGSVLRDEMTPVLSADFSQRVLQALEQEPVQLAPAAASSHRRITGPLAGLAVAASVVGIAILLQKPVIQDNQDSKVSTVAEVSAPALPLAKPVAGTSDSGLIVANSKNENIRERINQLLVEHNEYNPAGDMTGIMPYSRFVGYNPRRDKSE